MPQTELWTHYQTKRAETFQGARSRLDYLLRLARKHSRGNTLLNIGCGDLYLENRALEAHWNVISVDPSADSLAGLKDRNIDARQGTIERLPLSPESVDVVICSEVFEHLEPAVFAAGLGEIARVLRPGGLLIGSTPYREDLADNEIFCPECHRIFHRWGHHQTFDEETMTSALSRELKVSFAAPRYFPIWKTNWKGKLLNLTLLVLSKVGSHGRGSNLVFAAAKQEAATALNRTPPMPA